jgi:hypothetical protein
MTLEGIPMKLIPWEYVLSVYRIVQIFFGFLALFSLFGIMQFGLVQLTPLLIFGIFIQWNWNSMYVYFDEKNNCRWQLQRPEDPLYMLFEVPLSMWGRDCVLHHGTLLSKIQITRYEDLFRVQYADSYLGVKTSHELTSFLGNINARRHQRPNTV